MDYIDIKNKACCEIKKINSLGTLNSKMNHNLRLVDIKNADSERIHFNEELVDGYSSADFFQLSMDERKKQIKGETYADRFQQRIDDLEYYQTHKVRSNGVLAYEINLTYSPAANISIDDWKKANLEWLQGEFDVAPDRKSNVVSCVYHGDESNAHIHAIVIPIDEKGKLNASRFTDGWTKMVQYQDRYAKAMERFGLERGTHGSEMEHERVRKFYSDANKVLESTPKPLPGESAQEYFDRYREQLETAHASQYMRTRRECEEQKRKADDYVQKQRQAMKVEYAKQQDVIKKQNYELHVRTRRLEEKEKVFATRQEKVLTERDQLYLDIADLKDELKELQDEHSEIARKINFHDDFMKQYDYLGQTNPETCMELDKIMQSMEDNYNRYIRESVAEPDVLMQFND